MEDHRHYNGVDDVDVDAVLRGVEYDMLVDNVRLLRDVAPESIHALNVIVEELIRVSNSQRRG